MEGIVQPVLREICDRFSMSGVYLPSEGGRSYQSFPSLYDGVDVVPVGFHFLRRFEKYISILVCTSLIR